MDVPWTDDYRKALFIATVAENRFIPFTPHPKQTQYLLLADTEEILFGGAAGPGKVQPS
jgi:hypothetical protein